ncbi:MAG: single-stranded-DNA-specific exonuclease RecJ [Clostridia bacterium]|nr:single-stranded-DNA-specific exonuclease RecJ [Clostridia bacterium]
MTEQKKKQKKWSLQYRPGNAEVDAAIADLAAETDLSKIMAQLLYVRGYHTAKEVRAFFNQETACLHDPYLMRDIAPAVERISLALERGEKIAIYGDYDVDGVTSVSLLYLYLTEHGGDVGYYIPSRMREGYGLSKPAIDRLKACGVDLMITVDTGVTAIEETAYAKSLGIDTVITDHHECRPELPDACAVVNPHRADDAYPFKELAGVGVVFKLICAFEMAECRKAGLSEMEGVERVCREYADLVAIGTIADVMPVTDENRLIITLGLHLLEHTDRPGLRALIEAASGSKQSNGSKYVKKRKINSGFIGFTVAPRMNAAGRVSEASIAVELLLAENEKDAERLAEQLCELNVTRQTEENRIAEQAYKKIEQTLNPDDRVIVIDDDSWQQGIIGIVSSRITERYGLPSILISFDGSAQGTPMQNDVGKGSGRSIKGMNLVEALMDSEELLVRFGGHELAAGLSILRCNIDAFRRKINRYAARHLSDDMLCVSIDADCEVSIHDLSMSLAQEIAAMEPFGISNPVPNFVLRDARVLRVIPMGNGKHSKLIVEKDGVEMTAVWFGVTPAQMDFELGDTVDMLFQLNINEYQNITSLQMLVQDMRISETYERDYNAQISRYEEIRGGAEYTENEAVLPCRDDLAVVYTALRREFRAGHTVFPMKRLLSMLRNGGAGHINYIKLKFMIRIMQELQICDITEPVPDTYLFEFQYQTTKTNIEKSSILRKLKSQQRK